MNAADSKEFKLQLQQIETWNSVNVESKLQKLNIPQFKERVRQLTSVVTQISDIIPQRKAIIASFRNQDQWFVFKQFAKFTDFQEESRILDAFNQNDVLRPYMVPFDYTTFKQHFAIVYKRLVPLYDIINNFSPEMVNDLINWNIKLLNDVKSQGRRLCDHKVDNILYDLNTHQFFITDLEAVVPESQKCRVWTFIDLDLEISPIMFDHLHFIGSLYHLVGMSGEVDNYLAAVSLQYKQRVDQILQRIRVAPQRTEVSVDFVIVMIVCISMMNFKVNAGYLMRIAKNMEQERTSRPQTRQLLRQQDKSNKYETFRSLALLIAAEHFSAFPNSSALQDFMQILQQHKQQTDSDMKKYNFFKTCNDSLYVESAKMSLLVMASYIRCVAIQGIMPPVKFETFIIQTLDMYDRQQQSNANAVTGKGKSISKGISYKEPNCSAELVCVTAFAVFILLLVLASRLEAFDRNRNIRDFPCVRETPINDQAEHSRSPAI